VERQELVDAEETDIVMEKKEKRKKKKKRGQTPIEIWSSCAGNDGGAVTLPFNAGLR
jgi:hypothetical protein